MKTKRLATMARHFAAARWRWETLRGERLAAFQERRAHDIARYAAAHAPFYAEYWRGHDLAAWRELPTVDKRVMMANFARFNTLGVSAEEALVVALRAEQTRNFAPTLRGATVGLSSGTSGHRGIFLASPEEQAGWAGTILARTLHHISGRMRVAFFLRSNSNLYEEIGGALIQFQYLDLMTPLTEAVARLNLFQPDVVIGPPSLLGTLARAARVDALRIAPQWLISVAETLEPQDRAVIEAAFQRPMHEIYQCTEGLLAISCARGALHAQEDLVAFQFEQLDAPDGLSRRFSPIVTDLWRRTQPIIRYRLNDVLRLATAECGCGSEFQVIEAIEGRCDDVCHFYAQAGGTRPVYPDVIRRMILLASDEIEEYQAAQERPGQLLVRLALRDGANEAEVRRAVVASANATTARYGLRSMDLEIEGVLEPPAARTKRRRVRRLYEL